MAGMVENPDYLYSGARDHYGLPGVIDIMSVEPLL